MDNFKDLTTGAKLVLGATVLFLIVSIFNWFELDEAVGVDVGFSMWNGVGWIAGLLAIAILATSRPELRTKLQKYRDELAAEVRKQSL